MHFFEKIKTLFNQMLNLTIWIFSYTIGKNLKKAFGISKAKYYFNARKLFTQFFTASILSTSLIFFTLIANKLYKKDLFRDLVHIFIFFIFFFFFITLINQEKTTNFKNNFYPYIKIFFGVIGLFVCVLCKIFFFRNEELIMSKLKNNIFLYFCILFLFFVTITFISKALEIFSQNKKTDYKELLIQILPSSFLAALSVSFLNLIKEKYNLNFEIAINIFGNKFVLLKNNNLSIFLTIVDIFIYVSVLMLIKYKDLECKDEKLKKNPIKNIIFIPLFAACAIAIALNSSINVIESMLNFSEKNIQSYCVCFLLLSVFFVLIFYGIDFEYLQIESNEKLILEDQSQTSLIQIAI